ncbi:hypothetical protein NCAS_0C03410 [Naumovozyma castellii]|uniref:Potassium channel tetramerisation-type BTB domain-containing protein n=1 Tax=Naumovozyma castellii TaxID=27288 RepID=G0VCX0_NAUCA|nr:hypothetical protein NCAS_0C03410 [Naumovozyma castellii CBS 4309]CCC69331.1 hypothetical protein NCAS_0C03410 [Naumovozyma castellii CBS 4309]
MASPAILESKQLKQDTTINIQNSENENIYLPTDTVYQIKVGQTLFQVTGSSLNSDAPNFFTRYFSGNSAKDPLFIDRDADIFQLILKHLQGYFLDIKDEYQYTMLFTDTIFYDLPRLRTTLRESEYYFTNVGGESFKIHKNLFKRDGDSQNYFQVVLDLFYKEVEQRIENKNLFQSPLPPSYVPRSPEFFKDLLALLGGAILELTDERRNSLVKECRYYRFLHLEQKFLKTHIVYNPLSTSEEIVLPLKDLQRRGLRFHSANNPTSTTSSSLNQCLENVGNRTNCSTSDTDEPAMKKLKTNNSSCQSDNSSCKKIKPWALVSYKRPYVDEFSRDLIFQMDSTECTLTFNKQNKMIHVDLVGDLAKTFEDVFATPLLTKSNQNIKLSQFKVEATTMKKTSDSQEKPTKTTHLILPACISICDLQVNGIKCPNICSLINDTRYNENVIDFRDKNDIKYSPGVKLYLTKSLWKLGVKDGQMILIAIKAESFSGIKEYNKLIQFI